jgi:hypothetical protein
MQHLVHKSAASVQLPSSGSDFIKEAEPKVAAVTLPRVSDRCRVTDEHQGPRRPSTAGSIPREVPVGGMVMKAAQPRSAWQRCTSGTEGHSKAEPDGSCTQGAPGPVRQLLACLRASGARQAAEPGTGAMVDVLASEDLQLLIHALETSDELGLRSEGEECHGEGVGRGTSAGAGDEREGCVGGGAAWCEVSVVDEQHLEDDKSRDWGDWDGDGGESAVCLDLRDLDEEVEGNCAGSCPPSKSCPGLQGRVHKSASAGEQTEKVLVGGGEVHPHGASWCVRRGGAETAESSASISSSMKHASASSGGGGGEGRSQGGVSEETWTSGSATPWSIQDSSCLEAGSTLASSQASFISLPLIALPSSPAHRTSVSTPHPPASPPAASSPILGKSKRGVGDGTSGSCASTGSFLQGSSASSISSPRLQAAVHRLKMLKSSQKSLSSSTKVGRGISQISLFSTWWPGVSTDLVSIIEALHTRGGEDLNLAIYAGASHV